MTIKVRNMYYIIMRTHPIDIAVYGGAFNPPHAGHVSAIEQAGLRACKVLVVPSYVHPFGKVMTAYDQRVQWMDQITAQLRLKGVETEVSRLEQSVYNNTNIPVFSWVLLKAIAENYGIEPKRIALVVGEDVMEHLHTFKYADRLLQDFSVMIVKEKVHIHSTQIRNSLLKHKSIDPDWLAPGLSLDDYAVYSHINTESNVHV